MMHITAFYGALLGLLFVALSVRALRMRRNLRITVGDGGNPAMLRAMRVHANFAEYVPLALLLMAFAEVRGAHGVLMHGLGAGLLLGRLSHAYGVSRIAEDFRFRVFGMAMTLTVIGGAAFYLLIGSLRDAFA